MTELAWWNDPMNLTQFYEVNGCLHARVTELEFVAADTVRDAVRLAWDRVAALVWLAMPGHEDCTAALTRERPCD